MNAAGRRRHREGYTRETRKESEEPGDRCIRAPHQDDRAEESEAGSGQPESQGGQGSSYVPSQNASHEGPAIRVKELSLHQWVGTQTGTRPFAVQ